VFEARIIHLCIAQIDSTKELDYNQTFTIRADQLAILTKSTMKNAYTQLKKAEDDLFERKFYIRGEHLIKSRWISNVVYLEREGEIRLQFSQVITHFLSQLKEQFTQYRLENIMQFQSTHSIRIYELLMQWKTKSKMEVTLEWLKERLFLEDKYNKTYELKRKVLDVAIKEINKHSDMTVSYEKVKRGRSITGFIFHYSIGQPKKSNKALAQQYANPGDDWATAERRARAALNRK
jgi:plasmid replication initiation protein